MWRALTMRASKKACKGSKAVTSSVMATYCILPPKPMALMSVDHRGPQPLVRIKMP